MRGWRLSPHGDSALKVVSNEMQDFGSERGCRFIRLYGLN